MTTRTGAIAAMIGVSLMLAGCSGGAEPEVASTPTDVTAESAPAEPEPTPTEISIEEAGAQYLALVEPYNAALPAVVASFEANDLPAARIAAGDLAAAGRAFADGLVAAEWPASAQPAVDGVVAELAAELPIYLAIAASTEDQKTIDLTYQIPEQQGNGQKLRILLGLPDVPVS
ncbi:hypothetical protein [Oerskovia sp. Root22]|uniref:hypothetical protein n=1 Tax=Oerskovia sp. Root22 TaxID=1736494 RepID=UPI0006F8FAC7|nr:hypothetical protein [Oerskovia sp. Root22]KRC37484.1 hypothetical protein ASE15_05065 [Oerskovia sp. Root22]